MIYIRLQKFLIKQSFLLILTLKNYSKIILNYIISNFIKK